MLKSCVFFMAENPLKLISGTARMPSESFRGSFPWPFYPAVEPPLLFDPSWLLMDSLPACCRKRRFDALPGGSGEGHRKG